MEKARVVGFVLSTMSCVLFGSAACVLVDDSGKAPPGDPGVTQKASYTGSSGIDTHVHIENEQAIGAGSPGGEVG